MTRFSWIFGLLISAACMQSSFACQGSSVILDENNFENRESGWDAPDAKISYGASGAVIKLEKTGGYTIFNKHYTSDGTDLCTTMIWPSNIKPEELSVSVLAGILFWAKDYTNFYTAYVTNQGRFVITRYVANTAQLIASGPSPAGENVFLEFVNKQPGDKNELEVQIAGPKATFLVNGKKVADINGQPPPASGYVGLFASHAAEATGTAYEITFSTFQIATYP
jgi:hypothetical protein